MARVVTVFGASGFIGRQVVQRLAKAGHVVRAAVRDPIGAAFLKPMGEVGQVVPIKASLQDKASVQRACQGADAVINLVGILFERGASKFEAIHVEGAKRVAEAAKAGGAKSLVHVSALGADADSPSAYARSKAKGEAAVLAAFPQAVIIRPSVVFGPDDDFFNRFAVLARLTGLLPVFVTDGFKPKLSLKDLKFDFDLFGSGGAAFQPVYVGDLADAILAVLDKPSAQGRTFEIAGPRPMHLKEIMEMVSSAIKRRPLILPLPPFVGKIQAFFLQFLPKPPLTPDQMKLLAKDNLPSGKLPGLADLDIKPTAPEAIVPGYLSRHQPGARRSAHHI
ncbi:MAG: complex I NDUFA9 subunit family protein [Alphaproteobacteria bacterium]|nr:complex I NDUFA9 subunit family protein [Alphaproteobacteria bacterium]